MTTILSRTLAVFFLFVTVQPTPCRAENSGAINPGDRPGEEFAVFDGRVYNGKYYPRLEIIEWNEENLSSHMEFQNYTPNEAMDMSFQLTETNGKKVMMVRYHIKSRNEYVCRRVLSPGHFKPNAPLYYYKSQNDMGRDIIFVSDHPLPEKKNRVAIQPKKYEPCEAPTTETRAVASEKQENTNAAPVAKKKSGVNWNAF